MCFISVLAIVQNVLIVDRIDYWSISGVFNWATFWKKEKFGLSSECHNAEHSQLKDFGIWRFYNVWQNPSNIPRMHKLIP